MTPTSVPVTGGVYAEGHKINLLHAEIMNNFIIIIITIIIGGVYVEGRMLPVDGGSIKHAFIS